MTSLVGTNDVPLASNPTSLWWRWLPAFSACWLALNPATAQDIGKLYETRPPAGSAFVRAATTDGLTAEAKVQINATGLSFGKNDVASRYRPIPVGKSVVLSIDEQALGDSIVLMPDKFYTIVIGREGRNWKGFTIDEGQGSVNDLKAQLRFFNLMPDCAASLRITEGPVIFDAAESRSVKSRAVNPVQAELEASCNGRSASLRLPQLRAGDHYSLFFSEAANKPALTGQFDETEPYRER